MKLTTDVTQPLEERVARIESILARIASGDFTQRIPLDENDEDALTTIEVGINFMAQDLHDLFAANMAQQAKLLAQRQEIEDGLKLLAMKQATITALSTPVIQVWQDVLCLPLVGSIDAARATEMTERVIAAVDRAKPHGMIIDITGINQMDEACASALVGTARAVRLLGCEVVISGVSPLVAQTLVGLGADFGAIATHRTLWDGLRHFIDGRRGQSVPAVERRRSRI